jgi:hypothetical protein
MSSPPRILEIGENPVMALAFPDSTEHWSTKPVARLENAGPRDHLVTLAALPRLARALASSDFDVVVVQPGSFRPWHWQAIARALFRRSALRGNVPYFRTFGQELIKGKVAAPIAVWDMDDAPLIHRRHLFLLDRAALYFKRELPADHWRVFMGTVHHHLPTQRFRMVRKQRERLAKLRPISLGLPIGFDTNVQLVPDSEKTSDVFFAGRVSGSSTVREKGLQELLALREQGYRIDIPETNLSPDLYLKRIAQSWMSWAPEGYGHETFRAYEASVCGSVPIINYPSIDRYKPLRHGEHCFYYDTESGGLTQAIKAGLFDRERLAGIARSARAFVMAEHTLSSVAQYVVRATLQRASLKNICA